MLGVGEAKAEEARAADAMMLLNFMLNSFIRRPGSLNLVEELGNDEMCIDQDSSRDRRHLLYQYLLYASTSEQSMHEILSLNPQFRNSRIH